MLRHEPCLVTASCPKCDDGFMSAENPPDTLPIFAERGFDTAMRGYDRRQVDEFVTQLDDELRAAVATRDVAASRTADLAAQLASSQAQIESLRRQLQVAAEPVTEDNVEPRVRKILDSARMEAARLRSDAETYALATGRGADEAAERIRTNARAEAAEVLAEATEKHAGADEALRQRLAEADRYRADVTEQADKYHLAVTTQADEHHAAVSTQEAQLTQEAVAERERLNAESAAERARLEAETTERIERLEAEGNARRAAVQEDFEITLRARRTTEQQRSSEQVAAAQTAADQLVADATVKSDQLVADARAEADRITAYARDEVSALHAHRDDVLSNLSGLHERLRTVIDETPTP